MAETVAIICLSVLVASLIVALITDRRQQDKARAADLEAHNAVQEKLLDRIQAPEAAHFVAVQRATDEVAPPPPPPDLYDEELPIAPHLRIDELMED